MAFKGIDWCLRCGKELHASALPFVGDCCATKLTPEQLDRLRAIAARAGDPFHIPAPRPLSVQGRRNNAAARHAVAPVAERPRNERRSPAQRASDEAHARAFAHTADRILLQICGDYSRGLPGDTLEDRRMDRIIAFAARLAARHDVLLSQPAEPPAVREPPPPAAPPAVEQLELLT